MSSKTVWFITGVSSGFGLELALYALSSGHTVYGTVRSRQGAADAVSKIEKAGGNCVVLDVTVRETVFIVVEQVLAKEGRIDVLVNNAGWALFGTLESVDEQQARQQIETNFFGPFNVIQAVLPSMRERKSGSIVNISSTAGFHGFPGASLYVASKFALEGLSETLSNELAPFNISILIVEPGPFKTNVLQPSNMIPISELYKGTPAEHAFRVMEDYRVKGTQPGDTSKAAKIIFESVAGGDASRLIGKVTRLPLGRNAIDLLGKKIQTLQADYQRTAEVAKAADRDDLN